MKPWESPSLSEVPEPLKEWFELRKCQKESCFCYPLKEGGQTWNKGSNVRQLRHLNDYYKYAVNWKKEGVVFKAW